MFPFTLSGPPFLLFYAVLAIAVLFGFWRYARSSDGGRVVRLNDLTADPYKIACLRGGEEETLRVAVVNLVDRGLLVNSGDTLVKAANASTDLLRRPLDRAILNRCARQVPYKMVALDPATRAACADYAAELENAGLLRSGAAQSNTLLAFIAAIGLLGGIAIFRVLQALSHGRGNVLFLVLIASGALYLSYRIYANRKTGSGSRAIDSLERLMARLKTRAQRLAPGGAGNDVLLLAAIFGLAALPGTAFPFLNELFPRPRSTDSGGGWSDSGSSCSSGSSCGGGGGGCGGCGGS